MTQQLVRDQQSFAVQYLYQTDAHQESLHNRNSFDVFCGQVEVTDVTRDDLWIYVSKMVSCLGELDGHIEAHSKNWRLSRIAKVDLAVLRVGVFDLKYQPDLGVALIISNLTEIARAFGSSQSGAFVNGILDAVAHAVRPLSSKEQERRTNREKGTSNH